MKFVGRASLLIMRFSLCFVLLVALNLSRTLKNFLGFGLMCIVKHIFDLSTCGEVRWYFFYFTLYLCIEIFVRDKCKISPYVIRKNQISPYDSKRTKLVSIVPLSFAIGPPSRTDFMLL